MSHSGCAHVQHFQPRFIIFECRTLTTVHHLCNIVSPCSELVGGHRGSVGRHMATSRWHGHRAWPHPRGRHQRVTVRLPLAARRAPGLPPPQRLRRVQPHQRPDEHSVRPSQRSAGGAQERHDTYVQVSGIVGLRASPAPLETISGYRKPIW